MSIEAVLAIVTSPGFWIVNILCNGLVETWYFFVLAWVLSIKQTKRYWRVCLPSVLLICAAKPFLPPMMTMTINTVLLVGLPLRFSEGPRAARILVCLSGPIVQLVGELVAVLYLQLTCGFVEVTTDALIVEGMFPHYPLCIVVGHVCVFGILMAGLKAIVNKIFRPDTAAKSRPAAASQPAAPRPAAPAPKPSRPAAPTWLRKYLWAPILHMAVLFTLFRIALFDFQGQLVPLSITFALALLFLATDAVLFWQIARSMEQAREQAYGDTLESHIATQLDMAKPLQEMLFGVARLRHDLRNHKLVVQQLCAKGNHDRAAEYLAQLEADRFDTCAEELAK